MNNSVTARTQRYIFHILTYFKIFTQIPILILTAYRFFYPIKDVDSYLNANNFKKTKGYYFEKALTSFGFYYYIIDTVLTLIEGSYTEKCRFSFLSHHIPSIPLIYSLNKLNYMPWWTLSIAGWHALLICFPDAQFLNYPYLALIFIFHYKHAFCKPFCTMKVYQRIGKYFPYMYISLVIIWWIDCKNILPFV